MGSFAHCSYPSHKRRRHFDLKLKAALHEGHCCYGPVNLTTSLTGGRDIITLVPLVIYHHIDFFFLLNLFTALIYDQIPAKLNDDQPPLAPIC